MKITIIGGGYTGLLLGLCLQNLNQTWRHEVQGCDPEISEKSNIEFTILERSTKEQLLKNDHKSFALSSMTVKLLDDIGLMEQIKPYAGAIDSVHVFEDSATDHLSFNSPAMGYMIHSHVFKEILLNNLPEDNVLFNANWDDCVLKNSDLVIACDGRNSSVAKHFKISKTTYDYKQKAMLFRIQHSTNHNKAALEKFFDDGMIAILPLVDSYESSVVWVNNNNEASLLSCLNVTALEAILTKRLDGLLGSIKVISKPVEYPLTLHLLNRYYHDNILFFGDTLHAIHPIAGQGFNLTVADIIKLRDILLSNSCKKSNLHDDVLKNFCKSRIVPNFEMTAFTHILNGLFTTSFKPFKFVRSIGVDLISRIKPIKRMMLKRASGK